MTPLIIPGIWAGASAIMLLAWLVQLRTRNAGIVDAVWSFAMGTTAVLYAGVGSGAVLPRAALALLGGLWGLRLGTHIALRVLHEAEDGRYRYLRSHWHDNQAHFFGFFMLQALSIALFSLPFYAVAENPHNGMSVWIVLGALVWLVSIGGEALADRQLARFREDPANAGKTCRQGLWRYSRHPNYFFEWLHWFAYVFLAIGTPFPAWLLCLVGPCLMLASLLWVSGIPFAEAQALRSRGDDYREYQRQTSVLIPWFPRKAG